MTIILKNKETLCCKGFKFKCCIGGKGLTFNKKEGDKKTPRGLFSIGPLFYRSDRESKPFTKIKLIKINNKMGWCDDPNDKNYNRLIKINKKIKCEKLFRNDTQYNFVLVVKYNTSKPKKNKGSAIFIHLTKNYKKTLGCIALKKNDFLILIKLINNQTKIRIN